jgi:hypothetical protein
MPFSFAIVIRMRSDLQCQVADHVAEDGLLGQLNAVYSNLKRLDQGTKR